MIGGFITNHPEITVPGLPMARELPGTYRRPRPPKSSNRPEFLGLRMHFALAFHLPTQQLIGLESDVTGVRTWLSLRGRNSGPMK